MPLGQDGGDLAGGAVGETFLRAAFDQPRGQVASFDAQQAPDGVHRNPVHGAQDHAPFRGATQAEADVDQYLLRAGPEGGTGGVGIQRQPRVKAVRGVVRVAGHVRLQHPWDGRAVGQDFHAGRARHGVSK